jgi:hypothetical protein
MVSIIDRHAGPQPLGYSFSENALLPGQSVFRRIGFPLAIVSLNNRSPGGKLRASLGKKSSLLISLVPPLRRLLPSSFFLKNVKLLAFSNLF